MAISKKYPQGNRRQAILIFFVTGLEKNVGPNGFLEMSHKNGTGCFLEWFGLASLKTLLQLFFAMENLPSQIEEEKILLWECFVSVIYKLLFQNIWIRCYLLTLFGCSNGDVFWEDLHIILASM